MKRAAVVCLVWFVAAAAQAQTVKAPAPASGPAAAPAAPAGADSTPKSACSLVSQDGDQYNQTPLFGFDPSITSQPLPAPRTGLQSAMVMCSRATLIPELTDYRVLTEMHVPLAIRAGERTLFLGLSNGRLQAGVQDGEVTPQEKTALQDRLGEMQTAMAAKLEGK